MVKAPIRTPQASAFYERLVGTIRREWLDFMIPLNERHLPRILREWVHITTEVARTSTQVREFRVRNQHLAQGASPLFRGSGMSRINARLGWTSP